MFYHIFILFPGSNKQAQYIQQKVHKHIERECSAINSHGKVAKVHTHTAKS